MTMKGTGINPAGLVSALTGSGTLKLGAVEARELTPETLQAAIDTALKAPADKLSGTLRTLLTGEPSRGTVTLGPRSIALTLQDGVARTAAVIVPTPAGRIASQAALDLATFGMSGDWRIETRMPPLPALPPLPGQPIVPPAPTPATLLPPVVQRFALTPADLDPARKSKRPPPDSDAIEREMAVRKVERDLAELERIRRLDEERVATREREEKAALEAEKARQWETKSTGIPEPEPLPARR